MAHGVLDSQAQLALLLETSLLELAGELGLEVDSHPPAPTSVGTGNDSLGLCAWTLRRLDVWRFGSLGVSAKHEAVGVRRRTKSY